MSNYRAERTRILLLGAALTVALVAPAIGQDCLSSSKGCPKGQRSEHIIDQSTDGVAIRGYDPVAYFTVGHSVKGSPDIDYVWRDAHWHFSTADNRDAFSKEPERFSPQYGGYCAFGASVNVMADIDPDAWAVTDGKLYLYHSKTSAEKFQAATADNISKAKANWPGLQPLQQ